MNAGAPATLVVFWDYDTQWGADRSRLGQGPRDWGPLEFPGTDRLMELHERQGVPACFAVVGAAALAGERPYHDPGQVRALHEAGHEVASHSLHHDWLPGLRPDELLATLRGSREALEACIQAEVTTFVPPFNQPFDLPRRLAISVRERREAGPRHVGIPRLCSALRTTGYRFCRVAYTGIGQRLGGRHRPGRVEHVRGITCARVNTDFGFGPTALAVLRAAAAAGGLVVAYGHPHAVFGDGPQAEAALVPFLEEAAALRDAGRLRIALPRQLAP